MSGDLTGLCLYIKQSRINNFLPLSRINHLKTKPFEKQTDPYHSNTERVQYSDPHCTAADAVNKRDDETRSGYVQYVSVISTHFS